MERDELEIMNILKKHCETFDISKGDKSLRETLEKSGIPVEVYIIKDFNKMARKILNYYESNNNNRI